MIKTFFVHIKAYVPTTGYFEIDAETAEEAEAKYTKEILPKAGDGDVKDISIIEVTESPELSHIETSTVLN